jgi:hypothetical protein
MVAGMDLASGARLRASDPESYTAETAECGDFRLPIFDCRLQTDRLEVSPIIIQQSTIGNRKSEIPLMSYNASVMIAQDLLEILVCPACKQALEYRQNPESLKCTQCHRVYAVKDDIPIMLVDEATIEP